ncbi:UNVERIFIED_CONTAM: hypothetical protein Slati_2432100 [Sesamum latifolium]|uniref:Uncharacterized protein n=1 Tax=Sesamum latifolium TaxID=2727402 RepID=A0AAW2WDZ8_9LAMI
MKHNNISLSYESWGRRLQCHSVDGSGLTLSNMIRLESSGSCEEVRQNILGISWDENEMSKNPFTLSMDTNKWLEDNHKVHSIILASMTNEIQKQYDRLDDVPSIMLRMKEVYAVPNQHIRYAVTKAFFGTKMAEGSSVQRHGVKILSLKGKLEDLKAGLENDTYIHVILQSLPPSYNPFIVTTT